MQGERALLVCLSCPEVGLEKEDWQTNRQAGRPKDRQTNRDRQREMGERGRQRDVAPGPSLDAPGFLLIRRACVRQRDESQEGLGDEMNGKREGEGDEAFVSAIFWNLGRRIQPPLGEKTAVPFWGAIHSNGTRSLVGILFPERDCSFLP